MSVVRLGFKEPPDARGGIYFVYETAAVPAIEHSGEAPGLRLEGLNVHDLDQQQVAGLGTLDFEGPGEVVHLREVDVADVVGGIVVADLTAGPWGVIS